MNISHGEYLEQKLKSKKLELEQLKINHRINIAAFEVKSEMLNKDIDSLERQLEDSGG